MRNITSTRKGFTLVELMVAMALTMFIMVILSQAFILALETFSGLKGIGDMQINLRTAANSLRADLSQNHFDGARRLSDLDFTSNRPAEGFFVVYQGSASTNEGSDADGVASSTATNHVLHFSVKRRGSRKESFFTSSVGDPNFIGYTYLTTTGAADATLNSSNNPTFRSPWAEVAYYLVQTGTTGDPQNTGGSGSKLFNLYRAELVVTPDPTTANSSSNNYDNSLDKTTTPWTRGAYDRLSCTEAKPPVFNSPASLAGGTRALSAPLLANNVLTTSQSTSPNDALRGATLLMPNVLSFCVQAQTWPAGQQQANSSFGDLTGGNTYDSATTNAYRVLAVQITMRVWDGKSSQARQCTVTVDQ